VNVTLISGHRIEPVHLGRVLLVHCRLMTNVKINFKTHFESAIKS